MDTIVMTILPSYLRNIRIGAKDIELRKTFPLAIKPPFKVVLCESGSGGKVLAEFTCDDYYNIFPSATKETLEEYARRACVSVSEMKAYMGGRSIRGWRVCNPIDYTRTKGYYGRHIRDYGLSRPPQSWCYAKIEPDR